MTAGDTITRVALYTDWHRDGMRRFGHLPPIRWRFACPHCGSDHDGQDAINEFGTSDRGLPGRFGRECPDCGYSADAHGQFYVAVPRGDGLYELVASFPLGTATSGSTGEEGHSDG